MVGDPNSLARFPRAIQNYQRTIAPLMQGKIMDATGGHFKPDNRDVEQSLLTFAQLKFNDDGVRPPIRRSEVWSTRLAYVLLDSTTLLCYWLPVDTFRLSATLLSIIRVLFLQKREQPHVKKNPNYYLNATNFYRPTRA
jgi:hypothetical protein